MPSSTVMPPAAARSLSCIQIDLAQLKLAVPIDRVEKVVRPSQIMGEHVADAVPTAAHTGSSGPVSSGTVSSGIVYYADTAVTLLNLQQHLLPTATPSSPSYFLILRASTGELVAVPIPTAPNLVEFPQQTVKVLPATYRQVNLLGIASHVTRTEDEQTLFILDVDYLVTRWGRPDSAA
ncbi:MAG: chemotaxis protein CheW [Cyanobacteria bacterium J06632_22]